MKKLMLLVCPAMLISSAAWAAPACVNSSTLDSYIALGGGGCNVGGMLFNNFAVSPGSWATGVTVNTVNTANNQGLSFLGPFSAPPGGSLDVGISFVVSGASITGDTLSMTGFDVNGGGSLTVAESMCVGAAYAPNGTCSGAGGVKTLGIYANSSGLVSSASISFPSVTTLGVVKNIIVSGGPAGVPGSAGVSFVINTFPNEGSGGPQAIPEPASLILLGSGLVAASLFRRRRTQN